MDTLGQKGDPKIIPFGFSHQNLAMCKIKSGLFLDAFQKFTHIQILCNIDIKRKQYTILHN